METGRDLLPGLCTCDLHLCVRVSAVRAALLHLLREAALLLTRIVRTSLDVDEALYLWRLQNLLPVGEQAREVAQTSGYVVGPGAASQVAVLRPRRLSYRSF